MDELLIQRSRMWVQSSVQQTSLLSEASNRPPLLFSPPAKANLKREDNASAHFLHAERSTALKAQFLTLPQRRLTFMSLCLCPLPTLSARSSAVAHGVTPMFTGTSSILLFIFLTLFGFTLFFMSCHFSCFFLLFRDLFRETTLGAESSLWGWCLHGTQTKKRVKVISRLSNLVSAAHLCYFVL